MELCFDWELTSMPNITFYYSWLFTSSRMLKMIGVLNAATDLISLHRHINTALVQLFQEMLPLVYYLSNCGYWSHSYRQPNAYQQIVGWLYVGWSCCGQSTFSAQWRMLKIDIWSMRSKSKPKEPIPENLIDWWVWGVGDVGTPIFADSARHVQNSSACRSGALRI